MSGETSVIPSKNLLPTRKVSADKFYLASSSSYSHTHIPTNFHINKFDNFEVQLKIYKFNPISEGGGLNYPTYGKSLLKSREVLIEP